ncbi:GIY-YIG nuclease family protein [Vibrio alginolyticus]|uniref:GIY-YIG nuclease family protein n=1 Tax=Vibrio TaxID=662 RepID=UPI0009324DA3|nr:MULTISPECIES: GIY-YIG nuclease family protein [Vibrio]MBS9915946.1 GIY-YIG nuclease family protein [Vibrio alginolyticus]MDN8585821.1 GIY-YIG nuclease family protein [Vibrio alginolyticus]MDW2321722.1 GIY-YIG nuclease family protein [Vibrio sp. 1159]OUJ61990.1 hypothetical protein BTO03_06910 [Vibrio parahaemolyticus]TOA40598.1 hypothetical protein CGK28_06650 [Vibrio parahaemolyticus]
MEKLPEDLQKHGYIYIFVNTTNPNEIKIGLTNDPIRRRQELHTTGTAELMYVQQLWLVEDMGRAEKIAHDRMAGHRVNDKREFFHLVTEDMAIDQINLPTRQQLEIPHQIFGGHELAADYIYTISELIEEDWDYRGIKYREVDFAEVLSKHYFNLAMKDKYNSF